RNGHEGEVVEVLVVDGVELLALDEPDEMRELEGEDAIRLEDLCDAADEVVQVGALCEDVVSEHEVGGHALAGKLPAESSREELGHRRHTDIGRGLGDVHRRLDTEAGDAALDEVAKEVAIVARELDDERVAIEAEALRDHVGVPG